MGGWGGGRMTGKVKAFSKFVFRANNIKYPVLNDSVLIIKVIIIMNI
jgi:hypothetical protein